MTTLTPGAPTPDASTAFFSALYIACIHRTHTHTERERKVSVLASTQNKSKEDTHKKKKGEHQQNKGPREEEVLSEIARAKARATDVASLFSRKRTFNVSLSTEIRTMLISFSSRAAAFLLESVVYDGERRRLFFCRRRPSSLRGSFFRGFFLGTALGWSFVLLLVKGGSKKKERKKGRRRGEREEGKKEWKKRERERDLYSKSKRDFPL